MGVPGRGNDNSELIGASAASVSLLKGPLQLSKHVSTLSVADIRPVSRGDREELYGELDGTIDGFARPFWEFVGRDVVTAAAVTFHCQDSSCIALPSRARPY